MLVRLSKNSFVRIYDNGKLGYITNLLTRHDRTYDENGADFLSYITRQPVSIDEAVEKLYLLYEDANKETIKKDFKEFVNDLSLHKFVVIGETNDDLEA